MGQKFKKRIAVERWWEYIVESCMDGGMKDVIRIEKDFKIGVTENDIVNMYNGFHQKLIRYDLLLNDRTTLRMGFRLSNGLIVDIEKIGDNPLEERIYYKGNLTTKPIIDILGIRNYYEDKRIKLREKFSETLSSEILDVYVRRRLDANLAHISVDLVGNGSYIAKVQNVGLREVKFLHVLNLMGNIVGRFRVVLSDGKVLIILVKLFGNSYANKFKNTFRVERDDERETICFEFDYSKLLDIFAHECVYNI